MKNDLARTGLFGAVAGIVATMVMDIFVAVAMVVMGNPVTFMFSFIGDVASTFFTQLNMPISGGVPLGFLIHYLFGLAFGALFCVVLSRTARLKPNTIGMSILLGIVYIEIFSQPFLVTAPLVLKMTGADTLQWYALSTAMHAFYGTVLGILEHYRTAISAGTPRRVTA